VIKSDLDTSTQFTTMEIFKPETLKSGAYRSVFVQKGGAVEMDRYIYGMQGEGLGNWFGALMKQALPLISSGIKGIAKASKPIAIAAGKELITAGAKRGAKELTELSNRINPTEIKNTVVHRPHKKRRKSKKWQSL
jgi:hypothetical protein